MTALNARSVTLNYGAENVIEKLSVQIPKGQITVLVGANGCGKSTLLRALARLMKPEKGAIFLDGKEIAQMPTKEVAKKMAILPQSPHAPEGLTVLQLVKQGRYPYQSWLRQWSEEDEAVVEYALQKTGMTELADRPVDMLSGGQRQRAWIAMTLAQNTKTILLDEPTTYLDLAHQVEILDLLFELNQREKRTIVMVLHDLNLACRYADYMVAISGGQVYASGRPEEVMKAETVRAVFGMEAKIIHDPLCGTPMCIPYGKRTNSRTLLKERLV